MNAEQFLHLDQPRVISFRTRGNPFTFHFRRITESDWTSYFAGLAFRSQKQGSEQVHQMDTGSALLNLVEKTIERVEGYGDEFMKLPNWKERLHYGHKIAAGKLLVDVEPGTLTGGAFDPDVEVVPLDAKWTMDPAEPADGDAHGTGAQAHAALRRAPAQMEPRDGRIARARRLPQRRDRVREQSAAPGEDL
jgi:hypothetical protein